MAVANGVEVQACTPHILPGLYNNTGPQIRLAIAQFQRALDEHGIALQLTTGADAHLVPDFLSRLKSGHILSLADTRYVLVEPPHHVAPPRIEEFFFSLLVQGYVPVLTHPERLTWIEANYPIMEQMCDAGVWMQVTAGSLTGVFGRGPLYWAEKMMKEGRVHILATDAHGVGRRRPNLREGREVAAKWVGEEEANHLVVTRPRGVLSRRSSLRRDHTTFRASDRTRAPLHHRLDVGRRQRRALCRAAPAATTFMPTATCPSAATRPCAT